MASVVQFVGPLGLARGALLVMMGVLWVTVVVSHCRVWMVQSFPGQAPGCFAQHQDSGSELPEGLGYYPFLLVLL